MNKEELSKTFDLFNEAWKYFEQNYGAKNAERICSNKLMIFAFRKGESLENIKDMGDKIALFNDIKHTYERQN